MLTTETQERLEKARALQNNYQPNAEIADALSDKTLVMVVAPASMGKTLVMKYAAEASEDFSRAPIFSTRSARSDDEPGMFRIYPHDETNVSKILDKIEHRAIVQYAVHPTINTFYGTELSDYTSPYTLLATISNVVEHLRNLPFAKTVTIGLISEPDVWRRWFLERYPEPSEERTKRALEATTSLSWLLDQPADTVLWLHNRDGDLTATATRLIEQARGIVTSDDNTRTLAAGCLDVARSLI